MNLKRCPGCDKIIDIDNLENIDHNEIIGCGQGDEFDTCIDCVGEDNIDRCKHLREILKMPQVTTKEYYERKLQ